MQWAIDTWCRDDKQSSKVMNKNSRWNRNNKERTKLKFCPSCKYVWEKEYSTGDYIVKYADFPTIGLQRKCCIYCKSVKKENINAKKNNQKEKHTR